MNQKPIKAVILAAGRGTRRLPVVRVIDKAMLPIVNRPVIDYVVEQAVRAGVREIAVVVSDENTLIKRYYGDKIVIEHEYPWLNIEREVTFVYPVQEASDRYGTGVALDAARTFVEHEDSFLVLMADGFVYNDGLNPLNLLIEGCDKYRAPAGLLGLRLFGERAQKVSTIDLKDGAYLHALREKPEGLEPSQLYLTNISNYLLNPEIFTVLANLPAHNNEYYLTDAVELYARDHKVFVAPVDGEFCDAGNPQDWHKANNLFLG